ncbi:MAG: ornithine carbamoyltransferase [Acidobacteria bacterium]|nr:ornithine carbamoyltransferase [Acidobacteriota bacterium]
MKDFVSLRDFAPEELRRVLERAWQIKAQPDAYSNALKGQALAMIFEKPSLRTRVTFDVGMHQLGGFPIYLSPEEVRLRKRESVCDVAKNLERMVQAIMIRTFGHDIVEQLAEYADIPVINGLSDFSHPCQAMADFMTMLEVKGRFAGLRVAFVGDGNNVAHSLMFASAQFGTELRIATPPGYEPHREAIQWARARAAETGGSCNVMNDPAEAVCGSDVVYTDVWASMGQEQDAATRAELFRPYQVNRGLFANAKPDAIFMHCLPAHRGEEVTDEVIDAPHSVVFQQAENRLYVQKAILFELMAGDPAEWPSPGMLQEMAHA